MDLTAASRQLGHRPPQEQAPPITACIQMACLPVSLFGTRRVPLSFVAVQDLGTCRSPGQRFYSLAIRLGLSEVSLEFDPG